MLRRILLALATGYVFYFYSERMFWSFLRESDTLVSLAAGWLLYSAMAYATLIIIERFRVRSLGALFLAGVAFGWLVEGIIAMTFFGGGGFPLPFSIVWTGVAWHALITVLIGWYYLHVSLIRRGYVHTLIVSASLGLFWGIWAIAWIFETPPVGTTPGGFIAHAFGTTAFLALAHWVISKSAPGMFRASGKEAWALAVLVAAYTLIVTLPAVQFMAILLLFAFGFLYWLLRRNRQAEKDPNILSAFDASIPFGKYLCLLAMPAIASAVYIVCNSAGLLFRSNLALLIITSAIGTVVFLVSIYKVIRRPAAVPIKAE